VGPLLKGKKAKNIIYDKGRINSGENYDSPGPSWVPELVNMISSKIHS